MKLKRLTALLLALSMCLSLLCSNAWAAEMTETDGNAVEAVVAEEALKGAASGTCGEHLTWTLDDAGTLTISGTGAMPNWYWGDYAPWYDYCSQIKKVTIGNGVTNIGDMAFDECDSLTSVTIPKSVVSIGVGAFYQCYSLTSITIPSGVTSIGKSAFGECDSLTSVTISDSVTIIGDRAFSDCSKLSSITIPDSVTSIGVYAFGGCDSLTSVTIPKSVTSIGKEAFCDCSKLTSIKVNADNIFYTSVDGVLFTKNKEKLICCPAGKKGTYAVPSSVTCIDQNAFGGCSDLTSITIPNSVISIGTYAFNNCLSLTSITIPSSVTSVAEGTLFNCSRLTSVTIPDSVTSIDESAFELCSKLTDVYYSGTKEQWLGIVIGNYNNDLNDATIHFNSTGPNCGNNHTWDAGKVTKPATASAEGEKTFTCTVCGETRTEAIAKLKANAITASDITKNASTKEQSIALNAKATGGTLKYKSDNTKITIKDGKAVVPANFTGKANITITASGSGYATVTKTIVLTINKVANTITASNFTKTYSTKAQSFSIGATRKGSGALTYSSDNKSVTVDKDGKVTVKAKFMGKATITIKVAAKGIYKEATKKITVTVNPTKTTLSSVSGVKGGKVTVKWAKNTVGTGYEIQYSTSKDFSSGNKSTTVTKNTTVSKTITGLTAGKTYYVRIRTYKTVSNVKYYSGWSASKSAKVPAASTGTATAAKPAASTVYVTKTGKKFHRDGCSSLSKSKIKKSRADAVKAGYTPCAICKP